MYNNISYLAYKNHVNIGQQIGQVLTTSLKQIDTSMKNMWIEMSCLNYNVVCNHQVANMNLRLSHFHDHQFQLILKWYDL